MHIATAALTRVAVLGAALRPGRPAGLLALGRRGRTARLLLAVPERQGGVPTISVADRISADVSMWFLGVAVVLVPSAVGAAIGGARRPSGLSA